jgi:hypothetical protein
MNNERDLTWTSCFFSDVEFSLMQGGGEGA